MVLFLFTTELKEIIKKLLTCCDNNGIMYIDDEKGDSL